MVSEIYSPNVLYAFMMFSNRLKNVLIFNTYIMKTRLIFTSLLFCTLIIISGCRKEKTDYREYFVASYSVTETWNENNLPYTKPAFTLSIEKSSVSPDKILLKNFGNYGAGVAVEAIVNEYNITISKQTLANMKDITGTGYLKDMRLTITYTETSGSNSIPVTTTANKQ